MNARALFSGIAIAAAASLLTASSALATDASWGCYNNDKFALNPKDAGTVCVNLDVRATGGTPTLSGPVPAVSRGAISVSGGVGGVGTGALAAAAGDFGEVHLSGSSFYSATNQVETAVGDAYVSYTDELFVTKSVTATFTASADGVFSNASGSFVLRLNDLTIGGPQVIDFDAGYAALYDSVPSRTYTQQVDLQAGHTYLLYNAFEALASGTTNYANTAFQSSADMSNTGRLTIDAPVGSFTTLSGHDYSAGVGGVPEPSTWAMLMIGFVGLGFVARCRAPRALAWAR